MRSVTVIGDVGAAVRYSREEDVVTVPAVDREEDAAVGPEVRGRQRDIAGLPQHVRLSFAFCMGSALARREPGAMVW
jgi:hypothetical protein